MAPRDRVVLGALVSRRGASVSIEQLADALWGEAMPVSWRKVVHGSVVRLRKVLGLTSIQTTESGYQLLMPGDEVDAWRVSELVERSGELAAREELDRVVAATEAALALWRGEPFVELEQWPSAAGEIGRLQQLRGAAEDRRLEAFVALGRCDDAIAAATVLTTADPLRERCWELLALALYRSGRQGEALRALSRARTVLREELGVEPRAELAELELAILRQDPELSAAPTTRPAAASTRCPYKGLEPYDVADSMWFFGRDEDVQACRRRLAATGFLVVVGGSGSGKSSLVRAGLVPVLQAEDRPVAYCTPGADPVASLVAARLEGSPDTAVVVDQVEEMFTVCTDEALRVAFAENVAALVPDHPVVLVLRADHVGAMAFHPALGGLVEDGLHLLGPMAEPQLREAIEGPATEAGLLLEPGLVDLLVRDVVDEPGALPLLSHALAETWSRREGRVMTVDGYRAAGGVREAVAGTAERLYGSLSDEQQSLVRALFLRLVEVIDDGHPVRHRVPRDALDQPPQRQVVDLLLRARLVMANEDSLEMAHEALARAWPRLRGWLDEDRESQRTRRHLTTAARVWSTSGRDPADLYRGRRLDAAEEWSTAHPGEPTVVEAAFLDASRAASDQQARSYRLVARRLRRQVVGLTVLLVVALLAASLAAAESRRANRHADEADRAARSALISRLAAEARSMPTRQIDLGLLLALEAHRLQPSVQTEGALETALLHVPPGIRQVVRPTAQIGYPGQDPTGRLLAVPLDDGTVRLLAWPTLEEAATLDISDESPSVAVFSRHGQHLVVRGRGGSVEVWDVHNHRRDGQPIPGEPHVGLGLFAGSDPAGTTRVVTASADGTKGQLVVWDRTDVDHPRQDGPPLRFDLAARDILVAYASDDGALVAAGGLLGFSPSTAQQGTTSVWDPQTKTLLHQFPGALGGFVPGTRTLATVQRDRIVLWDTVSGAPIDPPLVPPLVGLGGPLGLLAFSPDGRRLAVRDGDVIAIFDLPTGQRVATTGTFDVNELPIAFLANGDLLTSYPGALSVWRPGATLPPFATALKAQDGGVYGQFIPGTHDAITTVVLENRTLRWDLETAEVLGPVLANQTSVYGFVSPDGQLIAAPTADRGGTGLWDLTTGERLALLDGGAGDDQRVAWGPDDMLVTFARDDPSVRLWDVTDPRQPSLLHRIVVDGATIPASPDSLTGSVDPRGRFLAVVDTPPLAPVAPALPSTVSVFDARSGRRLWQDHVSRAVAQVSFSPDGTALAAHLGDFADPSSVVIWDTAGGTRRHQLEIAPGGYGVQYLRGGDALATTGFVSGSPAVQLWDAATLTPIGEPLLLQATTAHYIDRDPAGALALVGTIDGGAVVWDTDLSHWKALGCAIAGRNLTRREWHDHLPGLPYHRTCPR